MSGSRIVISKTKLTYLHVYVYVYLHVYVYHLIIIFYLLDIVFCTVVGSMS